jgi:hypothetical protein
MLPQSRKQAAVDSTATNFSILNKMSLLSCVVITVILKEAAAGCITILLK